MTQYEKLMIERWKDNDGHRLEIIQRKIDEEMKMIRKEKRYELSEKDREFDLIYKRLQKMGKTPDILLYF